MERLTTAIQEEFTATRYHQYQPPNETTRTLEFFTGGVVEDPSGKITSWTVRAIRSGHELRLFHDKKPVVFLAIQSNGSWRGRDRDTGGICNLVPQPTGKNIWPLLANPLRFNQQYKLDSQEEGFTYKDHLSPQIEWSKYKYNLASIIHKDRLIQGPVAIAIAACDRVDYFKRAVQSIAQNKIITTMPVFVFLDKPEDDRRVHLVDEQLSFVKKEIPHAVCIKRPRNFGCGRNLIDIRRQLFDNLGYEAAFICEDDVVVTSNYFELCLSLRDWATKHYTNIGAVQGFNICTLPEASREPLLRNVEPMVGSWLNYHITKEAWDSIKDEMYTYEELFLGGVYKSRPNRSIRHWFDLKLKKAYPSRGQRPLMLNKMKDSEFRKYIADLPTGQDGATFVLLYKNGWLRLATEVNRAKHIGEKGIHMTPQRSKTLGHSDTELYEVDERVIGLFKIKD